VSEPAAGLDAPGELPVDPDLDPTEDARLGADVQARALPGELPVDPDLDPAAVARHVATTDAGTFGAVRRARWPRLERPVLAVVFGGGVAGGLARYGVTSAWPTPAHGFPWATFSVNTPGAFALALLVVFLAEVWSPHRYTRALVGTGFLGAFTTFSSVVVGVDQLAAAGYRRTAVIYLASSVLATLGAGSFGLLLGLAVAASRHRSRDTSTSRRR
jgi:CrcB protein